MLNGSMTAAAHAQDLADFVAASPSSYHAAETGAVRLESAGFSRLDETVAWGIEPGRGYFVVRDGALVAWRMPAAGGPQPFRVFGAHTDSPGFKLKPHPSVRAHGWWQLGVEVYGGPLLNSWLDRELTLAGRLTLLDGRTVLASVPRIARIPQLAIHLDRTINDGLKLDRQRHTAPVLGLESSGDVDVLALLAESAGVDRGQVGGYDVVVADSQAPGFFGAHSEFLASGRLDNLASVHAGLTALIAAEPSADAVTMVAAFDHEELGSGSRSGACGPLLADVTERLSLAAGGGREEYLRAITRSFCLSSDVGHSVHPNYPEKHDPAVRPLAGGGPILKINGNQRYATDALGAARWQRLCGEAGVRSQEFVSNNTVPCGSTIGPLTATRLGMTTVDVGIPILSMHSAREMCAVSDLEDLAAVARRFFA